MIKNIKQFVIRNSSFIIVFFLLVVPSFSQAAGLVDCTNNCQWNDLLALVNKVIHFILFDLSLPIAAIMFAYAGVLLITSGARTENRAKAKEIFINTLYGLLLAVAAWLIVMTILNIVGYQGDWIGFPLKPSP